MGSDAELFAIVGGILSFIGWLLIVVPIFQISHKMDRTNELLEYIGQVLAANTPSAQTRVSLEDLAANARAAARRIP